jgi:LPXTG-site transpeptidase (sortase) family protein
VRIRSLVAASAVALAVCVVAGALPLLAEPAEPTYPEDFTHPPDQTNAGQKDAPQSSEPAQPSAAQPALPYRMVIPAIGLDTPIVMAYYWNRTWHVHHISSEVGYLQGTALPGQGSNVGMAAHSYVNILQDIPGAFVNLEMLQPGDHIHIHYGSDIYVYQMTEQLLLEPWDIWVLMPTESELLTMVTCVTWNPDLVAFEHRLAVRANLVEVIPISPSSDE